MTFASKVRSCVLAGSAAGLFGLAIGATPAAAQKIDAAAACTPDVMRLCSEFIPDEGRITACLRKKRMQLTGDCRTVMSGKRKRQR